MAIMERWKGTQPIPLSTDEAIASAVSLFSSNRKIIAAYLFGSRAFGSASSDSDIDLAFHPSREFSWDDYYLLRRDLSKAFHSDRFDLLWLDRAAPDITFDVLKHGRTIYYQNEDLLNDFELYAKKRYWDYAIYLRERSRRGQDGYV
ncbi:MAG TPA: nucleotidyltransferase domain-containing protein [Spirochaetota bacterium]|nr:nucleotidyltransferase domain-containing protein [Spirochaetota bacterium]